jgi:hypothetical protein
MGKALGAPAHPTKSARFIVPCKGDEKSAGIKPPCTKAENMAMRFRGWGV